MPAKKMSLTDAERAKRIRETAREAGTVMARWQAVELAAKAVHESDTGRKLVQAMAGKDGVHALIRDQHGVTMEIACGKLAVTIAAKE
jgi:adenine C2-methylase RlmN of 23S rRNA A2503 and tRNA A37